MATRRIPQEQPQPPYHIAALLFLVFLATGIFWGIVQTKPATSDMQGPPQSIMMFINFVYIGLVTSITMVWMWRSPKKNKARARRVSLLAIGLWLVLLAGLMGTQNLQIEGFFFAIFSGALVGGTIHYSVSKIFGPLVFGRSWCGWACWTAMVLDSLPFKRSPGRLPHKWLNWLPYVHFGLSLLLIAVLWYIIGYRPDVHAWGLEPLLWFVVGNALYYAVAIGMAYALRDNRAFCKYLCPVNVPIRIGARFSIMKIGGDASKCNGCDACTKMCPMDIRIPDYIQNGERVLSDQCIMCQNCVNVCAKNALQLSLGLDAGRERPLRLREIPISPRQPGQPASADAAPASASAGTSRPVVSG